MTVALFPVAYSYYTLTITVPGNVIDPTGDDGILALCDSRAVG